MITIENILKANESRTKKALTQKEAPVNNIYIIALTETLVLVFNPFK